MAKREIEDRFIATYLEDARKDRVRPLAEYQALFPGHESSIAREYLLLEEDEHGDTEPPESASAEAIARYRILRELGHGGQARVYLAFDPRLGREVALKVFETSRFGLDVDVRMRRFRREAELTARLDHPGICGVLDVGEDDATGVVFIAMRYVKGRTLAEWISEAGSEGSKKKAVSLPTASGSDVSSRGSGESDSKTRSGIATQPFGRVLEAFEQIARSLHVAHEQGLVHRDVKPGNIMITATGDPVILDFGLARDVGGEDLGLTLSGDVLGTPYYMSPEQVRGEHSSIDRRTDIFSAGVVLYECLTLQRPFDGNGREALCRQILDEPPQDLRKLNRSVPRDLRIVVETAMEKDRERRYPTALAFADDLRRVRRLEPITARALPATLRMRRWVQRNPVVSTFLAVVLIALVAVLGLYVDLSAANVRLDAANVRLEAIRIAAALRQVSDSMESGAGDRARARRALLNSIPPEKRGLAWNWLDARNEALAPLVRIHSDEPIREVSFGRDGESLLAVLMDRRTANVESVISDGELWSRAPGSQEWTRWIGPAFTVEVSPDQKIIAVGEVGSRSIQLYDARSYAQLGPKTIHGAPVTAICWSRDGRQLVSGASDGGIKLWRLEGDARDKVSLVEITPDGLGRFPVSDLGARPRSR